MELYHPPNSPHRWLHKMMQDTVCVGLLGRKETDQEKPEPIKRTKMGHGTGWNDSRGQGQLYNLLGIQWITEGEQGVRASHSFYWAKVYFCRYIYDSCVWVGCGAGGRVVIHQPQDQWFDPLDPPVICRPMYVWRPFTRYFVSILSLEHWFIIKSLWWTC